MGKGKKARQQRRAPVVVQSSLSALRSQQTWFTRNLATMADLSSPQRQALLLASCDVDLDDAAVSALLGVGVSVELARADIAVPALLAALSSALGGAQLRAARTVRLDDGGLVTAATFVVSDEDAAATALIAVAGRVAPGGAKFDVREREAADLLNAQLLGGGALLVVTADSQGEVVYLPLARPVLLDESFDDMTDRLQQRLAQARRSGQTRARVPVEEFLALLWYAYAHLVVTAAAAGMLHVPGDGEAVVSRGALPSGGLPALRASLAGADEVSVRLLAACVGHPDDDKAQLLERFDRVMTTRLSRAPTVSARRLPRRPWLAERDTVLCGAGRAVPGSLPREEPYRWVRALVVCGMLEPAPTSAPAGVAPV